MLVADVADVAEKQTIRLENISMQKYNITIRRLKATTEKRLTPDGFQFDGTSYPIRQFLGEQGEVLVTILDAPGALLFALAECGYNPKCEVAKSRNPRYLSEATVETALLITLEEALQNARYWKEKYFALTKNLGA